jgi:WD40 repeat protein
MSPTRVGTGLWLTLLLGTSVGAADPAKPPQGKETILRLEAGGPTADVKALVFGNGPDGKTPALYVAGSDKVVRVWTLREGRWELSDACRVPIGPGGDGIINALAVSPDGRWLAAAGLGLVRDSSGFRDSGVLVPRARMTPEMFEDQGTIFLFDRHNKNKVRPLRGHTGPVLSLAFAPQKRGKSPLLVSLGREGTNQDYSGVLRLWDVSKEKDQEVSKSDALPDPANGLPALAPWHAGDETNQVCVALSVFYNAKLPRSLSVWNGEGKKVEKVSGDEVFNNALAFDPDNGVLYQGRADKNGALVQGWRINGAKKIQPDDALQWNLAAESVPVALALLPNGKDGGRAAAVVVRQPKKDGSPNVHELILQRLQKAPLGERLATVQLWSGVVTPPALAASPDGRWLAVAGNREQEVLVFNVEGLLGRKRTPQRLSGDGTVMEDVAFVRKGQTQGLRLKERGGRTMIFDFEEGRLSGGGEEGWKQADEQDKKFVGKVRFGERWREVIHALRPGKSPLLAVAYVELGVTYLALYDVETGQLLRHYTGHVDTIRSLAFSGDGRLLATTAEDRTVCVWSLTDLPDTVGKRGTLRGMAVTAADGKVIVSGLMEADLSKENAEALKSVKEGDVVESIAVRDGKSKLLKSPTEFYQAVWELAPRTPVTLQIGGRGEVKLTVDQGIDDQKPLLTLFFPDRTREPAQRRWVGWSPWGYFDASHAEAMKRYIGWHENTGKPDDPVLYALPEDNGKYCKEYHRPQLLKFLVQTGNLGTALNAWQRAEAPKPNMDFAIVGEHTFDPRDRGHLLLRRQPQALSLTVSEIPHQKVAKLQWQLDDKKRVEIQGFEVDQEIKVDLDGLKLERGPHVFRLVVTTEEAIPQQYTKTLPVLYLPPAPTVKFDEEWLKQFPGKKLGPLEVMAEEFLVKAVAKEGENPKIRVVHNEKNHPLDKPLKLAEGQNFVVVIAENDGSSDDRERDEQAFAITYKPKPVDPPRIALSTVTPDGGMPINISPEILKGEKALVVHVPKVVVKGRITCDTVLTKAQLNEKMLETFKAGQLSLEIDETVKLKPDTQVLTFSAAAGKHTAEKSVRILYQPALPKFTLLAPKDMLEEKEGRQPVDLSGTFTENKYPYSVEILLDGKSIAKYDSAKPELKVPLRFTPGWNEVEVRWSNKGKDWEQKDKQSFRVYCKQPPRVLEVKAMQTKTSDPFATLEARLETPKDRPLKSVWVNGPGFTRRLLDEKYVAEEKGTDKVRFYKVSAAEFPLQEGKNVLEVWCQNEDGPCSDPGKANEVTYEKPVLKRPEITFLQPSRDTTKVSVPKCSVSFSVRWDGRRDGKRTVGLKRNNKEEIPLQKVETKSDGMEEVYAPAKGDVRLDRGANVFSVVARNEGGEALPNNVRTVIYDPPPVEVFLDELVDGKGNPIHPGNDGVFKAVGARVTLRGHLKWDNADDPDLKKPRARVRAWVNSFEQLPGKVEEAGKKARWRSDDSPNDPRRRDFEVPIRLNLKQANEVELRFDLPIEERGGKTLKDLKIECTAPEKLPRNRLHLLAMAPGQKDQEPVQKRLLDALQIDEKLLRSDAFADVQIYGKDLGENVLLASTITGEITKIKEAIANSNDDVNHVILIYIEGTEVIREEKNCARQCIETMGSLRNKDEKPLVCDGLRRRLDEIPGAKVMVTDVKGTQKSKEAKNIAECECEEYKHMGVVRYVWVGKQQPEEAQQLARKLKQALVKAPRYGPLIDELVDWVKENSNAVLDRNTVQSMAQLRLFGAD